MDSDRAESVDFIEGGNKMKKRSFKQGLSVLLTITLILGMAPAAIPALAFPEGKTKAATSSNADEASQSNADKASPSNAESCICTTACIEEQGNEACPVCSEDGANCKFLKDQELKNDRLSQKALDFITAVEAIDADKLKNLAESYVEEFRKYTKTNQDPDASESEKREALKAFQEAEGQFGSEYDPFLKLKGETYESLSEAEKNTEQVADAYSRIVQLANDVETILAAMYQVSNSGISSEYVKVYNPTFDSASITLRWEPFYEVDTFLVACTDTDTEPEKEDSAWKEVGNVTSLAFEDLEIGRDYYFWINARSVNGQQTSQTMRVSGKVQRSIDDIRDMDWDTSGDVLSITTKAELAQFCYLSRSGKEDQLQGKTIRLRESLNISDVSWPGIYLPPNTTFDGCGETITYLMQDMSGLEFDGLRCIGLFAAAGKESKICNLTVDGEISASILASKGATDSLGTIVGYTEGVVDNCDSGVDVNISIQLANGYLGGVAGYLYNGEISYCEYWGKLYAEIISGEYIGGIAGICEDSTIRTSTNGGEFSSMLPSFSYVGGIAGYALPGESDTVIEDCINEGDNRRIGQGSSTGYHGGFVGICPGGLQLRNCLSTGTLKSHDSDLTGIIAYAYGLYGDFTFTQVYILDETSETMYGKKTSGTEHGSPSFTTENEINSQEFADQMNGNRMPRIWDIPDGKVGLARKDATAPTVEILKVERTSDTYAKVTFQSDEEGTVLWKLTDFGDVEPELDDYLSGGRCRANEEEDLVLDDTVMSAGSKRLYLAVKDDWGNVSEIEETTIEGRWETTAPVVTITGVKRISDTEAEVRFRSDEAGTCLWVVTDVGEETPDLSMFEPDQECEANEEVTLRLGGDVISAGAKHFYLVVEDARGNISEIQDIEIPEYREPEPEPEPQPQKPSSSGDDDDSSYGSQSGSHISGEWKKDDIGWRYQWKDGTYAVGWVQAVYNGVTSWYYFNQDGYMMVGWYQDTDGNRYYLHPVSDGTMGHMYTGWHLIDSKNYYFNEESDGYRGALRKEE